MVLVETIGIARWWLQALIPLLTVLIYILGLYYTLVMSEGRDVLKELSLSEVIGAAQTEHVRDLLESGNLDKTMVQYKLETGFIVLNNAH